MVVGGTDRHGKCRSLRGTKTTACYVRDDVPGMESYRAYMHSSLRTLSIEHHAFYPWHVELYTQGQNTWAARALYVALLL